MRAATGAADLEQQFGGLSFIHKSEHKISLFHGYINRLSGVPLSSAFFIGCSQKRISFFPELRTPTLFVHGTSDPFATLGELMEAMAAIPARTGLFAVAGAGHDLKRSKDLYQEILRRFCGLLG